MEENHSWTSDLSRQEREIIHRCEQLGLDSNAPQLIRYFVEAAFYHANLPGTPLADRHVAICSGLRNVTLRIACRWRQPGRAEVLCRNLSSGAVRLRNETLKNTAIGDNSKYSSWKNGVTVEHHYPIRRMWEWIENDKPSVDDVVEQLVSYPIAIITREEDERLNRLGFRVSGRPEERYGKANIELNWEASGALDFFQSELGLRKIKRRSKYDPSTVAATQSVI